MAINDEIAAGGRPVQFENPLNTMVKFANIQNDMSNMALHRQKTAESQRLQADDVNFKNAMASIADPYSPEGKKQVRQAYYNNRMGDKFEAMQTSEAAVNKSNTDVAAKKLEMRGQAYRNIVGNPSPENISAHNQDFQLDPDNSSQEKAQSQRTADMLVALPLDQRVAWLASQGGSAADLKQHIGTVNTGGSTVTTSTNPFSGKTIQVGEVAHTLTPEQNLYTPTDLEDKQARYKALAKQTADQKALIARTSGLGLPGTVEMLTEQQKARTAEQDVLRGEIDVLQKQGQSVKHASAEFLQVSARLEQLRAAGQENGPEGKALQARIAKETHIPPASGELSEEQLDALYGPSGAVTLRKLDPYKINGRNAKILANAYLLNPNIDMNKLGGEAALGRNPNFMNKQYSVEMLPTMLKNMVDAGTKLKFSDVQFVGKLQAWYKGQTNDPAFVNYMAQRNDFLLGLAASMRGNGATDQAHRAEIEAAHPTMSPSALAAYAAGEGAAFIPRLELSSKFTGTKPPAEAATPNAPAKTVTGQTVKNW